MNHKWYKLDGFVMRNQDRQKHVRKINTVGEVTISDHKPKKMVLNLERRAWRKAYVEKKVPHVKWKGSGKNHVYLPIIINYGQGLFG